MVGSHDVISLQHVLVLGVRARIASLVPSIKSQFPVNSQQLLPVFG